uniref:Phosphoenolpyruvate carboxylase n=1 Tax=Lygus hesperus TaxID=30085 RepID=A0A0A9WZS3_LYGHE
MERRHSRSSLSGNSDSESSLFKEFQEREQQDKELFDTPKRVSGFINEERWKAISPGKNSIGNRSFHGSSPSTPTSNKNVHEAAKKSLSPTKVIIQADVNPIGLTTIKEEEKKKKRNKKLKVKKIEVLEYGEDPIGICLVDSVYYMASFII